VPLPSRTLRIRRTYCWHRHAKWLVPSKGRDGQPRRQPTNPSPGEGVQNAMNRWISRAEILMRSLSLRYAVHATHLLEAGALICGDPHTIGPARLQTTMVYLL